jgi:SEC-C motif
MQETEIALSFYRDPELLREVIARANLPERAERVAVALADGGDGPHVVVTRDARFVTCLAKGMTLDGLPVVSRARLDVIAASVQELRRKLGVIRDLATDRAETFALFDQIYTRGDAVPRETIETLRAAEPVLARHFAQVYLEELESIDHDIRRASRIKHPKGADLELLRRLWERAWLIQHVSVLMVGDTMRDAFEARGGEDFFPGFVWQFATFDTVGFTGRALWSIARFGKVALGPLKRALARNQPFRNVRRGIEQSLLAIGLRHSRTRAEIAKALAPPQGAPEDSYAVAMHRSVTGLFEHADVHKEVWPQRLRIIFEPAVEALHGLGLIESADTRAVPDDVLLAGQPRSEERTREEFALTLMLPAICRSEASRMYLPARWAEHVTRPWTVARTRALIERYIENFPNQSPKVAPARPGRNDPCQCQSGKKFKRCCGA